ncbi:cytochrome P450 4C1-like [Schistocerca cancellata]|uniref:cytochrome P450 4C1-like n=1 Tax=Schistocerca cancellata TaxID=274614 RepID=UPI0021197CE4|nr:cytochrome P450 4C1-like [Schistocerca cancellata]
MAWWLWLLVHVVVWCCAGVVVVLWRLWATRAQIDAPGPPTLPIIGNILQFRELPLTLRKLRDLHDQYGDLTRFYIGPVLVLMVVHPDDVQHIMLTSKMVDRDPFLCHAIQTIVGDGLLSVNGSQWKTHRKLINPTFHSELLGRYLEAFHEGGLYLGERLARTGGANTEVHPPVTLAALRTVASTIIGLNPDVIIPDALAENEISTACRDSMSAIQTIMMRPWLQSKFLVQLTSTGRRVFKFVQILQNQVMQCIAIRSAAIEDRPPKKHLNLLEALVKPGGKTMLPVSEVRDELMNVVMAGTETVAVSISFVLALLALHPEWQDAAHQELRDVFGEGDDYLRAASLADLHSLRVLESIIKETLRICPTVPVISRVASEDLRLPRGRVLVPKGTVLLLVPGITQRLPQFYPDPLRFDPSRFLDGRRGEEHACSYLPFGVGARSCVGTQYARLQLKVFLAEILRRFRFLPHSRWEDLEDASVSISLHTMQPIRVSCVPLLPSST